MRPEFRQLNRVMNATLKLRLLSRPAAAVAQQNVGLARLLSCVFHFHII
jgi:hypothetical protein